VARICPDPSCGRKHPDSVAFCGECGRITIQEQAPDDVDPRLGQRLGDYLVVARVADGAMGRVYEARHHQTRERVAIKVLHRDVARDPVAAERFKREYETANEMSHPNVVKVIHFGTTEDGLGFMTMEYLEGEELGHVLRRDGEIAKERLIRFVCQAALGLDYAHSFGFIHRDLKPDNIFLCRGEKGDEVRILDFGSVKLQMATGPKLTAFGTTLGSPFYMSPEQAMGKQDVDQRTDVFALAAIVYESVTGKIAFEAGNVAQILMKIINQEPVPPSQLVMGLPPRIDDVVEKGLRKDKNRRYASASDLAKAVCEAFGLTNEIEKWANAAEAEVVAAVGGAVPPAAKAFGALSEPPPKAAAAAPVVPVLAPKPAVAATPVERAERSSEAAPLPVKNNSMLIGLAVGALLLVSLVLVLLMR
jgi:serine/threonine-protein kinase